MRKLRNRRDGKCSSCVGAPCEHECHEKPEAGHA